MANWYSQVAGGGSGRRWDFVDESLTGVGSMRITELVDQSAAVALEHAAKLQDHLRSASQGDETELRRCRAELHTLVGDIVSLRNAAELLKRENLSDVA